MHGIERYFHEGPGYEPFLIRDGWQVAQLNFLPELRPEAIRRIERHKATDEVFILFDGRSQLLAAVENAAGLQWEVCRMERGVTYNIPAGMWHSIAMSPGDVVLIVEKSNTHLNDVEYRELSAEEYEQLQCVL